MVSRREWIAGMGATAGALVLRSQGIDALPPAPMLPFRPEGVLVNTHVHMFSDDPVRFPYSKLSYKPKSVPVGEYVKFALEAQIDNTVLVQPEPYQDDHRYIEYCFTQEPFKFFFKGTCLFDPIDPATPKRLQNLVQRNPGRFVALRIHELHPPGTPSTTSGVIRDRDLQAPQMMVTWRAVHELGLGILVQLIPHYANQIGELAAKFPNMPVYLDHLARPGQGTPEEYEEVLKLADLPNLYMKYTTTGVQSAATAAIRQANSLPPIGEQPEGTESGTRQPGATRGTGPRGPRAAYPFLSAKPLVKKIYNAFGADRIMWGELGTNVPSFEEAASLLDIMFDFAPETERRKIRGLTAQRVFAFSPEASYLFFL